MKKKGSLFILQTYFIHNLFRKSTSNILLSLHIKEIRLKRNTSIWKIHFLYTTEFEHKYLSLESLLQVYF